MLHLRQSLKYSKQEVRSHQPAGLSGPLPDPRGARPGPVPAISPFAAAPSLCCPTPLCCCRLI